MPVKVVDEEAAACDPLHFCKKLDGLFAVEVVKEEGGVDDIDAVVGQGKGKSISDLNADLRAEGGRKVLVQVSPRVSDGHRIGIKANEIHPTVMPFGLPGHVE